MLALFLFRKAIPPTRMPLFAFTTATAFLLLTTLAMSAQDAPKPPEPEYTNAFYLRDPGGTLKPLERQPVGVGTKVSMLGFGGAKASYEIQGDHSPIRIPANSVELATKLEKNDVDPATVVLLYPLKVVKGKRQLLLMGVGFMSLHSKSDMQSKQIQMNFTKFGQGSLKITPATTLPTGEYAIAVQQSQGQQLTAYCFGVD